jgi:opacity protein-like surface antigen
MTLINRAALTVACVALAGPAIAADLGGGRGSLKDGPAYVDTPTYRYYLGVKGGWTFPEDTDFNVGGTNISNGYDTGYTISGVIGTELSRSSSGRLRGDLEFGYSEADVSGGSAFGRKETTFGMASLYYDFETGSVFRPFIGAGGGIADVDFHKYGTPGLGRLINDNDTAYAYHLTGGVGMQLSPTLDLEVSYRYFGTTGAELRAVDGTKTSVDTQDQQILVGLRQKF